MKGSKEDTDNGLNKLIDKCAKINNDEKWKQTGKIQLQRQYSQQ